jgi:hypothetical protein
VAEAHHRELPDIVREKSRAFDDPGQPVLAMLGARVEVTDVRGSGVAESPTSTSESSTKSAP